MSDAAVETRAPSGPDLRFASGGRRLSPRGTAHLAVAALAPITALTLALVPAASIRMIVLCLAAAALPGTAILAGSRFRQLASAIALIVTVSITVDGCAALVLLWGHWFHPAAPAAVIGGAAALWLLGDVRTRLRAHDTANAGGPPSGAALVRTRPLAARARAVPPRAALLDLGPLLAGLALWLLSLLSISLDHLGTSGLLAAAPAAWYGSLVLLTAGSLREAWIGHRGWLLAAYLGGLTLVLFATIPALASAPQYTWVYKHIAVIHLFIARGSVSSSVDIYNRFPGMFALAGALTKLSGLSPVAYANWVQPVFTWLSLLLIYAIALTITARARAAGIAALLFLAANWIGQIYLSPQTLALVLFLGFVLLAIGERSRPEPSPVVTRVCGWLARWMPKTFGTPDSSPLGPTPLIGDRLCVPLLLGIDFLITATHQLTPYMLLIALGLLVLTRSVHGWKLWVGCLAITLAYLLPNYSYLQRNYGLLGSFNLSDIFGVTTYGLPVHRAALYADAGDLITLLMLLATFAAAFLLIRRGHQQKTILLLAMALIPALILPAQDYGGEGPLRVFMFSLPWQATLIGFALTEVRVRVAVPSLTVLTSAVLTLCLLTTAGDAALSVIPAGEVQAAWFINDHIDSGAAVVLAVDDFPVKLGDRYPDFNRDTIDGAPILLNDHPDLVNSVSNSETIRQVIAEIDHHGRNGVIVFSSTQYQAAAVDHLVPLERLRAIEAAVAASPKFELWFENSDTRIYRLKPPVEAVQL